MRTVAEFTDIVSTKIAKFMDDACRDVIALGYRPDECRIDHVRGAEPERQVLVVRGVPAYEVTFGMDLANNTFDISARPLSWPPIAPQVRADTMG